MNDKEEKLKYLNTIISSLNDIKNKVENNIPVGNDDWVIPAATLREALPLFMYNNPDKEKIKNQ